MKLPTLLRLTEPRSATIAAGRTRHEISRWSTANLSDRALSSRMRRKASATDGGRSDRSKWIRDRNSRGGESDFPEQERRGFERARCRRQRRQPTRNFVGIEEAEAFHLFGKVFQSEGSFARAVATGDEVNCRPA